MNSTDQVNTLLNYGYSFLESRCRATINSVGLESSIGFLHEIAQPKYPLVYDLQEPFRFLAELTVLKSIRSKQIDINDFFFTGDDYHFKFNPESKHKFMDLFTNKINSTTYYLGKKYKYDTLILKKTKELANYISNKSRDLDFLEPKPNIYYM